MSFRNDNHKIPTDCLLSSRLHSSLLIYFFLSDNQPLRIDCMGENWYLVHSFKLLSTGRICRKYSCLYPFFRALYFLRYSASRALNNTFDSVNNKNLITSLSVQQPSVGDSELFPRAQPSEYYNLYETKLLLQGDTKVHKLKYRSARCIA